MGRELSRQGSNKVMTEFPRCPTMTSMLVTSSSIQKWLWPGLAETRDRYAYAKDTVSLHPCIECGNEVRPRQQALQQESLAAGRTTLRVKFQVGDSLKHACSHVAHGPVRTD